MARHDANSASPCSLDKIRATEMARLGTPYCGALREENSLHNVVVTSRDILSGQVEHAVIPVTILYDDVALNNTTAISNSWHISST